MLIAELFYSADESAHAKQHNIRQTLVRAVADNVAVCEALKLDGGNEIPRLFDYLAFLRMSDVLALIEFATRTFPEASVMALVGRSSYGEQSSVMALYESAGDEDHARTW